MPDKKNIDMEHVQQRRNSVSGQSDAGEGEADWWLTVGAQEYPEPPSTDGWNAPPPYASSGHYWDKPSTVPWRNDAARNADSLERFVCPGSTLIQQDTIGRTRQACSRIEADFARPSDGAHSDTTSLQTTRHSLIQVGMRSQDPRSSTLDASIKYNGTRLFTAVLGFAGCEKLACIIGATTPATFGQEHDQMMSAFYSEWGSRFPLSVDPRCKPKSIAALETLHHLAAKDPMFESTELEHLTARAILSETFLSREGMAYYINGQKLDHPCTFAAEIWGAMGREDRGLSRAAQLHHTTKNQSTASESTAVLLASVEVPKILCSVVATTSRFPQNHFDRSMQNFYRVWKTAFDLGPRDVGGRGRLSLEDTMMIAQNWDSTLKGIGVGYLSKGRPGDIWSNSLSGKTNLAYYVDGERVEDIGALRGRIAAGQQKGTLRRHNAWRTFAKVMNVDGES